MSKGRVSRTEEILDPWIVFTMEINKVIMEWSADAAKSCEERKERKEKKVSEKKKKKYRC